MNEYYAAWWNVENLFDIENSLDRPDYLQKQLKSELKGWTDQVLAKKISQLAKIIKQMNNNLGPDILGVCEVENRKVLTDLRSALGSLPHNYDIAHADTGDKRGIDVAFIYDADKFRANEIFSHAVLKRSATRDLFQVNMETTSGNKLILIGNHWPARSAGTLKSEPYRILVGETLTYWHERIIEIQGEDAAIIAMGDFNDEPFNRSLVDYALSWRNRKKVVNAKAPKFFNLMWETMGKREGSFYYNYFPNLYDQFMVSKGCLKTNAKFTVKNNSVAILTFPEMVSTGYPDPIPFKRPSHAEYNENGFSDHYPIGMIIQEQ